MMTSLPRVSDVQMPPQGTARGGVFSIGDPVTCRGPMAWSVGKIIDIVGDYAKVRYKLNGVVKTALILKWRLEKV